MSYEKCGKGAEPTLCWDCANTCTKNCSWAEKSVPVDGWEAEKTEFSNGDVSYLVKKCPKFVKDSQESRIKDINTDGCMALVEQLMAKNREDYIKGDKKARQHIEKFLRGHGAGKVHQIQDPEKVIRMLKKDRKEYWEKELDAIKQSLVGCVTFNDSGVSVVVPWKLISALLKAHDALSNDNGKDLSV